MKTTITLLTILIISNYTIAQWQQTTAPSDPSGVYALATHENKIYAGIASQGVYITSDQGVNWIEKNEGLTSYSLRDFAFIENYIFVATSAAGVFRTTENDTVWTSVSSGLYDLEVYALTVKGTKIFAGAGGSMQAGVYMSDDNANNWIKVSDGLTLPAAIRALSTDGQNIYTGVYGNANGAGVYYSTNDGGNWIEANNGITNKYVWKLAVMGDTLFAGMDNGGGIYRSTNQGTLWEQVNTGLTDSIIQSFIVSEQNIYVGTYTGGVFLSTNAGENWEPINTGLINLDIKSLAVDDFYIYAGTAGAGVGENGVWRRPLSEIITSVEPEIQSVPIKFIMDQNYPNPFNPSTKIKFSLVKEGQVNLSVFNILGELVEELKNEVMKPGYYEVEFNASELASGIYLYRIKAGDFVETKKMILIK